MVSCGDRAGLYTQLLQVLPISSGTWGKGNDLCQAAVLCGPLGYLSSAVGVHIGYILVHWDAFLKSRTCPVAEWHLFYSGFQLLLLLHFQMVLLGLHLLFSCRTSSKVTNTSKIHVFFYHVLQSSKVSKDRHIIWIIVNNLLWLTNCFVTEFPRSRWRKPPHLLCTLT